MLMLTKLNKILEQKETITIPCTYFQETQLKNKQWFSTNSKIAFKACCKKKLYLKMVNVPFTGSMIFSGNEKMK